MKNTILLLLTITMFSVGAIAQITNSTPSTNPVELIYEKDEFTDKEYLWTKNDLLITQDGKKGFKLYPRFSKENGKWSYTGVSGVSTVGNCFENDKVYIIFEDGSKFDMTSWRKFNCDGDISFDLYGKFKDQLTKPIKGIKFQNGRTFESFEKIFTNPNDKNYFINAFKALDEYNSKN
jgi:hypothetical protein